MYTSYYDRVFTCLRNSSLRIRHFFLIRLRRRIRQILLYEQNTYLIQVASPCFYVFPMFWKVASSGVGGGGGRSPQKF